MQVEGKRLRVNGAAICVAGVNRHEHDPALGKAITEAGMLEDILLMKQLNFNAVRCSHYPNAQRWHDPTHARRCNCCCSSALHSRLLRFCCVSAAAALPGRLRHARQV